MKHHLKQIAREYFLPLFFYIFLVIIITLPLVLNIKTRIAGFLLEGKGDLLSTLHIYWWTGENIRFAFYESWGIFDFLGRVCNFPFRYGVWNIVDGILMGVPLTAIFGFPAGYNIEIILILVLNGFSGFLLIKKITNNLPLSLAGGLIISINPYILRELYLGRPIQVSIFFIPLFLLITENIIETLQWRWFILAGLMAGLASAYYWFNFHFLILIFLIFFAGYFFRKKTELPLEKILVMLIFTGLLIILSVGGNFKEMAGGQGSHITPPFSPFPSPEEIKKMGIPGFEAMSPLNPALIVARSLPLESLFSPRWFFPLLLFPLTLLFMMIKSKNIYDGMEYLAGGFLFWILSLGPYLKIGSTTLNIPLPYALLFHVVPFFSRFYFPYHLSGIVIIFFTVYLCKKYSLFYKENNIDNYIHKNKIFILIVITVLFMVDLFIRGYLPLKTSPFRIPAFYLSLADSIFPPGGLIELPHQADKMSITDFYQIFHRQPVLGNRVEHPPFMGSRLYHETFRSEQERGNTFLEFIQDIRNRKTPADFLTEDLELIKKMGFSYIVIHRYPLDNYKEEFPHFSSVSGKLEKIFGKPVYSDPLITVFSMKEGEIGKKED